MVLTKRLMGFNKSPRRINRNVGGRNKKVNIKGYPKTRTSKKRNNY